MSELHERLMDGLFDARWQPGVQPEFHKGANKQSRRAEEQSEVDKMNHIVIELANMPILALEMPVSKQHTGESDPPRSDTTISFLDIIEIIIQIIVDGAKALFPKRKANT